MTGRSRHKLFDSFEDMQHEFNAKDLKATYGNGEYVTVCIQKAPIGITLWHDGENRRAIVIDIKRETIAEAGVKIGDFVFKVGKYNVYDALHSEILNCIRFFCKYPPIYIVFYRPPNRNGENN